MANLNKYPLQDGFETSLAQSWNWAVGTIFVNSTPSFTFPSGVTTYVVVNPWKTTQQVAEINAYNAVTNTLTASNVTIEKAAGVNYSATTHAVGSKVIISDNYQFWKDIATAINSKVNKDEASIIANTVQLQFGSTAAAIYTANSGTDLTFKDWSNPAVTLSTLASGGWADTKVSISLTDTTPAVLNSKLTAGDGLSKTIINPSDNEILDLDIDVTDTTIFVQTSSGAWDDGKVPRLNVSGKVASWFIDNSTLTPESLNDVDTYRAWEDVIASNSLFVEDWPTFAESTLVQNVGDVAGNTRFARPFFGSWVAINTFKLWLNKTLSPSVNFGFRIETDNAGSPSGTLANANATGTVTSASLTTSLVDTTVTLAGSITLTLWQRYWIVWFAGTYGSETVNASNFFGVGYVGRNTTTRSSKRRNGTARTSTDVLVTDTDNITFTSTEVANVTRWYRMQAIAWLTLTTITKSATCTATRALVKTDANVTLHTITFVWNVATLPTPQVFETGVFFRLECDNNWSSFTNHQLEAATFPQVRTNVRYIEGLSNWIVSTTAFNIDSIGTIQEHFAYLSTTLSLPKLLSKTDAKYTYKLPTDLPRIATETKSAGSSVIATTLWLNSTFTGMTPLADMFISNTAWVISSTAGTNLYSIGKVIDATNLFVGLKTPIYNTVYTTLNSTQSWTWTNTSSTYLCIDTEQVMLNFYALSAGWSSNGTSTIQFSLDGISWWTNIYAEAKVGTGTNVIKQMSVLLRKWVYYRTTSVCTTSGGASVTLLTTTFTS